MSVLLCLLTGICILIFRMPSKSMFARQKVGSSWETSLHCARTVPHGSTICYTRTSAKTEKQVEKQLCNQQLPWKAWMIVVGPTYHGVSPTCSGLRVLSNGCSTDHVGLCFYRAASKENLPMSCSSPDREGTRVRQYICSSCPQNLCNFRKSDIVTSQRADCATNTHRCVPKVTIAG